MRFLVRLGVICAAFLVPLAFNARVPASFQLPKLTALRLCASVVGLGLAVKRPRIGKGVLPYLFSWFLSARLSPLPRTATQGSYLRMSGTIEAANLFVLYLGAKASKARQVLSVLMASGLIAVLYGFLQKAGIDIQLDERDRTRPSSSFGNPIAFGGFLAMLLPPVLSRFKEARSWKGKMAALLLAGGYCSGIALSRSRGAILAAVAGVGAWMIRAGKARPAYALLVLLPLARINWRSNRLNIWRDALRVWKKRPLFGFGNDCIRTPMLEGMSGATEIMEPGGRFDRAHNLYLDELTMRGLFGLLTFLRMAGLTLVREWKTGAADLFGMSIAFLTQNATAFPTASTWLAWWLSVGMSE